MFVKHDPLFALSDTFIFNFKFNWKLVKFT